jgi:hypothetical protein
METQKSQISDNDIAAIERALGMPNQLWHMVMDMEEAAETEEGRRRLHDIRTHMYHLSEYGVL